MQKTVIVDIKGFKHPDLSLEVGQSVAWRNLDPVPHTVNTDPDAEYPFDAGTLFPGDVSSPVTFTRESGAAGIEYICEFHAGMKGVVKVGHGEHGGGGHHPGEHGGHHGGGHDDHAHLKHFHGFVTGGSTGHGLFMTHTPIFNDERHHFQIILRGSFAEQKHAEIYNRLRQSEYGHGKFQLFFDHLAMVDIESGAVKELQTARATYYPLDKDQHVVPTRIHELVGARVRIDRILHFRKFDPDMEYPDGLAYLMYGDMEDIFIDHYISRAPNFHSVAKLAKRPDFWTEERTGGTLMIRIPSRRLQDVSPKFMRRVAFLDNRFHLVWGMPSGAYSPEDPLKREPQDAASNARKFEVLVEGTANPGAIEVSHLLHFDATQLLNL